MRVKLCPCMQHHASCQDPEGTKKALIALSSLTQDLHPRTPWPLAQVLYLRSGLGFSPFLQM